MYSKKYLDYLQSLEWQEKRQQKLKQAKWHCEQANLGSCKGSLQVHHKTYDNLGNEPLEDLGVLCEVHHQEADIERRFDVWATRKYGANYETYQDEWELSEEYWNESESRDLAFETNYNEDWNN